MSDADRSAAYEAAAQAELDTERAFVHKLSLIADSDDDKRRALQAELDAARANATAARCALAWAVEAAIQVKP